MEKNNDFNSLSENNENITEQNSIGQQSSRHLIEEEEQEEFLPINEQISLNTISNNQNNENNTILENRSRLDVLRQLQNEYLQTLSNTKIKRFIKLLFYEIITKI